ncbi:MAG: ABC transporter substrate-binding protein [Nitrococcus sp.]|nr:ABC transporter substrate-binding protein [Nitrococcus sp.]
MNPPTVRTKPPAEARTIVNFTGRSVPVPRDPQRIAVLAPVLDVLATIEPCTNRISGGIEYEIAHAANTPTGLVCPGLARIPVVSTRWTPDPEKILKSEPDVVIAIRDLASNLEAIGYPSLVRIDYGPESVKRRDRVWRLAGRVLNHEERAARLQSLYRAEMEDLRLQAHPTGERQPRVIEMFGSATGWRVSGGGYYLSDVLSALGAVYAADGVRHASGVSQEDLFVLDPDVILLQGYSTSGPEALFDDPSWQAVTAVKMRRVYKMPPHNQFNEAVDLILTATWLAHVLRPEAPGPDLVSATQNIFTQVFDRRLSDSQLCRLFQFDANNRSQSYRKILPIDCPPQK